MARTCMHTIGFLCTCLHSLPGTLVTCCIAIVHSVRRQLTLYCMLTSAPLSNNTLIHSMCPAFEAIISAVPPSCNDKCISSWEYHQCQIHTTHQSDREYTRTSTTHSSTTHSTNTKKAPLGGTYSASSYPMMSYTANILPPIPKIQTPSLHQDIVRQEGGHRQGLQSSTTEQKTHSHKTLSVHCASSPECNIKSPYYWYLQERGTRHSCRLHNGYYKQNKFPPFYTTLNFSLKCFSLTPGRGAGGRGGGRETH